jgi:hypothetical protein
MFNLYWGSMVNVQLHCVAVRSAQRVSHVQLMRGWTRASYQHPTRGEFLVGRCTKSHPYCAVDTSTHIASRVWDTIAYSLSAAAVLVAKRITCTRHKTISLRW